MNRRICLLVLVGLFAAATASFAAEDVSMGTWKLNEGKSKIAAGMPKYTSVVYSAEGDNVKVTVDGVDGSGKTVHNEWIGKFDGKDYPVTGDASVDTRSYKRINSHTLDLTNKKDGKVTMTTRAVVSADGKSRTSTGHGMDASGKKVTTISVYDKQ